MNILSQQIKQFRLSGNNCWTAQLSKTEIRKKRKFDLLMSTKKIKSLVKTLPGRIFQSYSEGSGMDNSCIILTATVSSKLFYRNKKREHFSRHFMELE